MSSKKIIKLSSTPKKFGETPDELDAAMFDSELPIQNTHSYYENDELGLYVGLWDTTEMVERSGAYPCDEFMWILDGEVEIKNSGTGVKQTVQAGEAFIIPKGFDCQWHQSGYLRKFFMISEHPEEDIPNAPVVEDIIKFKSNGSKQKNSVDETLIMKHKNDIQNNSIVYKNHNGKFYSGSWSSDSFQSEFRPFPVNEFVYLVKGTLILTDETDKHYQFESGDAFFVPKGVICKWQSMEFVEVIYAILES